MEKITTVASRHWKYLIILNLLVLVATVGKIAVSRKVWTANAQLILPNTTGNLDASLGTLGTLQNGDSGFSPQVNPLKVQTSILTSDALLEQVRVNDPEKSQFPTLSKYKQLFDVSPQEQSTLISLAVNGSSPEVARQRAIALIQQYQQRLNELRQTDRLSRKQFSQKELERSRQSLAQAQIQLAQFKESTGLINSEEQTKGIVTTLTTLTTAQAQAQAQAQANENRVRTLATRLSLTPVQAIQSLGLGENQDYQFVRNKLAEVDATLVQTQVNYTEDHPRVQSLLSERNELQRQIQGYITQASATNTVDGTVDTTGSEGRATLIQQMILAEGEASSQQRQAEQLQSQIEKLNKDLKSLPANQARLLELERQSDVVEGVYKGLLAQVNQSSIDAFNVYPNVQVLDPPTVDLKPSSPKVSLTVISALMASVLGSIALVLFLEGRNPLLSPKDLQAIKFPLVAGLPRLKHSKMGLRLESETDVEFQLLASAISLQPLKDRRLLVTSAIVGEGKTTVTLGLARALVDLGFRVLVVDGDFRQAGLSRSLGYTQDLSIVEQPVQLQQNLDFIPTLPKQGKIVEMVTRGRFKQSLAAAQSAKNYDYVLIDSAPVSQTSETALMTAIIPNVLFIVRSGVSDRDSVTHSLNQLAQHNAKIVGLVVNGLETRARSYPYRSHSSLVKS
ncbi:MAG: AAA family ATPase [Gloeocapsa sp. UFS-A4-WI-NPMV-4B04]|jgi:uncharacterized protein involved in exopolysaccharide biosynthesis|nr:AAA family ATPase [Gloeocapsa sp. UFS-A4-WI-NPMV-4B04]